MNRYLILLWCMLAFLLSGCFSQEQNRRVHTESVPEALAQVKPASEMIVARVNGKAIRRKELTSVLLRGRGERVLEELIVLEAVRQEAAKHNIRETNVLIEAEWNRILADMAPGKPQRDQLALLEYMLESRGLTRPEFDMIVERQALLRALVDPNVEVTEQELRSEYERQHGKRVEVRQVVVGTIRKIEQAQKRLASREDFLKIVLEVSEEERSLVRGGLLGPFSLADNTIPEPIRTTAMGLQTAGQISDPFPYRDATGRQWWCLLRLERMIRPDGIPYDSVRDELIGSIQNRQLRQRMNERERSLRKNALVEIVDPILIKH